jgi:hypothetical protein
MEASPLTIASPLTADDLASLARARLALEREPLAMKLAGAVGAPVERLMARLPQVAHETIAEATRRALDKCLQAALASFKVRADASPEGTPPQRGLLRTAFGARGEPRDLWHKLAVATTGAAGGAFGLLALPAELPLTTTLMFRSICDIARSEGEDLLSIETQLQCLSVFGLGGGAVTNRAQADEGVEFGYFVTRGALAQAISKASSDLASKSIASHSAPALLRLMNSIAARFSVQVSEQVAAKSIPAIGAVLGALANTVFIDHFQQTAHGHFTIRRLERRYGSEVVQAAYQAIERSPLR